MGNENKAKTILQPSISPRHSAFAIPNLGRSLQPLRFLLAQDVLELGHELVDVLERPVYRGEADVGDLVEQVEPVHELLADDGAGDLLEAFFLEGLFDLLHRPFKDIYAD